MGEILSFLKDLAISFDFDTELNTKKTIEIKGTNLYVNGKKVEQITEATLNVHEAAKITNAIYDKLYKKEPEHFENIATYSIVQELQYLQDLIALLQTIRRLHCETFNYVYNKFCDKLNYILNRAYHYAYTVTVKRPYPERLALNSVCCQFLDDIAYSELSGRNVDEVLSIIANTKKNINSFNYSDYQVDMGIIVAECSNQCDKLTKEFTLLKKFIEDSGGKLVDWGKIKIQNEMRKAGLSIHYASIEIVLTHKDLLLKSGATPKANVSTLGQSKLALVNGTATQDQLLRLFKQGTSEEAENAISFMSFDTLKEIINSDLNVITSKLMNSYSAQCIASILLKAINKIAPQEITLIANYMTKYDLWTFCPDNFLQNNIDIMTADMVRSYASSYNREPNKLSKEQFEKIIKLLDPKEYYSLSENFTHYFFMYGTPEQKLYILNNHTNPDIKLGYYNLHDKCSDIPKETLKEILLKNSDLIGSFHTFIKDNQYQDLMKIYLNERLDDDFLSALPAKDRVKYIVKHNPWSDVQIKNVTEAEQLLEGLCKVKGQEDNYSIVRHVSKILKYIFTNEIMTDKIKKIINDYKGKIDLREIDSISIPDHWKIIFLRNDCLREYKVNNSFYYQSHQRRQLISFFSTLPRESLIDIYGENFNTSFVPYIAHCMTQKELESFADKDKNFLFCNVQLLTYEYLKKYKDKDALRIRLGDLRDSFNAAIKYEIQEQLKTLEKSMAI